jgi:hypothetical protein
MQVNNIYMNQTLKKLTPLLVVFTVLLSSNFINAAWSNPTATPPGNNAFTPINESLDNQLKQGDITARNLKAGAKMWSPLYCDERGEKCVDIQEVRDLLDGSSSSPTPTFSNCTLDGATVAHGSSRQFYSRTSATNCNSYDQNRTCNDGTLGGSNSYSNRSCSTSTPTPTPTPVTGCMERGADNYNSRANTAADCRYTIKNPSWNQGLASGNREVQWCEFKGYDGAQSRIRENFAGQAVTACWLPTGNNCAVCDEYPWTDGRGCYAMTEVTCVNYANN